MHFTVLVAGENPQEMLAPYQQNNMGDCPEEFLQFVDQEDEFRHDYDNEGTDFVKTADGRVLPKRSEEFLRKSENGITNEYFIPEGAELIRMPYSTMYSTFEEYVKNEEGYGSRDEKSDRYGYWSNPDSKWDWYQLGGRWRGLLKAKEGVVGVEGESGIFDDDGREGYYDQLRKGDIDWNGMVEDERKRLTELFAKIKEVVAGREIPAPWDEIVLKNNGNIEAARTEYNNHPVVLALRKEQLIPIFQDMNKFLCDMDEQKFVESRANNFFTAAILTADGWKDDSCFNTQQEWVKYFNDTLAGLSDDTLLSIYDCHI